MEYRIEKIIGSDDNYVILQVNQNNKNFIVNVEQFVSEDEEIEKYFNVQDVINGTLAFDATKSVKVNSDEMIIEQEIYKFSSFSRLSCKVIGKLDQFKYIAKIADDIEIVILSKKSHNFEIGNTYLIEGYFWLLRENDEEK